MEDAGKRLETARQKVADACFRQAGGPCPQGIPNACIVVVKDVYKEALGEKIAARVASLGIQRHSGQWKPEDWRENVGRIKVGDLACFESSSWFYGEDQKASFNLVKASGPPSPDIPWIKCLLSEYDELNEQHRRARKTGNLDMSVTIAGEQYTGNFRKEDLDQWQFQVVLTAVKDGKTLIGQRGGWTGHVGVVAETLEGGHLRVLHWRGREEKMPFDRTDDVNFNYKGGLWGFTSLELIL